MKRAGPGGGLAAAAAAAATTLPSLEYAHICEAIDKRLFVGKLPSGTTEDELRSVFATYGQLTECRVVPAHTSGNTVGFVGYTSWASAHRALLHCDGKQQFQGQAIVVSFAERKREGGRGCGIAYAKGLEITRVFVGCLPEDVTENEIASSFGRIAFVDSVSLLPAKSRSRCAIIAFNLWGEAMDAIECLAGMPLRGDGPPGPMTVALARPRPEAPERAPYSHVEEPTAKRRRAGSPVTVAALLELYAAAVQSDVPRQQLNQLHEQLMIAREAAAPPQFGGRMEHHDPGPAGDDRNAARLFVGGLPGDLEDDELRQLAQQLELTVPPQAAELLECRVLPGKGCGYLRYATWEAAEEAFDCLHQREVSGWPQALRVKWASPPGSRGGPPGGGERMSAQLGGGSSLAVRGGDSRGYSDRQPDQRSSAGFFQMPEIGEAQAPPDPLSFASEAEIVAQGLEPTRLFVGQLSREIQDVNMALKPLFEQFGHTCEFRYVPDKGILYVSFKTFDEARTAMQALAFRPISGVSKCLNVKFSQQRRSLP